MQDFVQRMKNTIAYVCGLGDREEQGKFFSDIRHISLFTQLIGIFGYVGGYLLLPAENHFSHVYGVPIMAGVLAGFAISAFCRTLPMLNLGGILFILSITCGFRVLCDSVSNPTFWTLPMGIIISLTMAALFNNALIYLGVAICVWWILGFQHFPLNPHIADERWPQLIILSGLISGLILNVCFRLLRHKNYLAQRELEIMAFKDALTGIDNRRSFTLKARQLQQNGDGPPLYFLMIDIDNFKKINDTLGHDAGDQVLKKTADIIALHAGGHLCGRLGGEEFGVVFQGEENAACAFAAQLVAAVFAAFNPTHAVSISIGIAELIKNADLAHSYKRADACLYQAKSSGKNCYVIA